MKKGISSLIISLAVLLFALSPAYSQDERREIDSLYRILEITEKADDKFEPLKQLLIRLESFDINEGLEVYKRGVELMPQISDPKQRFWFYLMTINYCMRYALDYEFAKSLLPEAKGLAKEEYDDIEYYAALLNAEAYFLTYENKLAEAMEIYNHVIKLAEEEGNLFVTAGTLFAIGIEYYNLFNYQEANSYFTKGLAISKELRPITPLSKGWEARFNQYTGTSLELFDPSKADSALSYVQEGYRIYDSLGLAPVQMVEASLFLGSSYFKAGNLERATRYIREGMEISRKVNLEMGINSTSLYLIKVFFSRDEPDSLKKYLEIFESSQANIQSSDFDSNDLKYYKSGLEYHDGHFRVAYDLLSQHKEGLDSLYTKEKRALLTSYEIKYQISEKEKLLSLQELEIARVQNSRNQVIIGAISALFVLAFFYQRHLFRQNKRKQQVEIDKQRAVEETKRLKELDQLKSDFFTNISHELRTPLTLILNPASDAIEQAQSSVMKDKLKTIQTNGQRLMNLVNEIMDLSKVEAGKMEVYPSVIQLDPFLERIFYSFESLAELRRINYRINIDFENIYVETDRDKLEKILNNLLSNAIKYTPSGGRVILEAKESEKGFSFLISDNGPGIPPEDREKIFNRFYQVKHQKGSLQGGTGVGLALSKELAELLGGKIELESSIGQGSTFTLYLPLAKTSEMPKTSPSETELGEASKEKLVFAPIMIKGEKPKILIVEDNPQLGKYLTQLLQDDYQSVLASDGMEALKQLRLNSFELILSDVMMPNMDGFELRERINENQDWKQVPFVLLTARHLEEDRIKGFQLGIDDYLTKPFSKLELQARIHNLISNKLERDAFKASPEEEENKGNVDQNSLKKLEAIVLENLSNPQFGVENLASEFNYSSKQTRRVIKELTGLTTVAFILEVRLQKARELLERKQVSTVVEAQLSVGIESASYFTRKFTERFGINPKDVGAYKKGQPLFGLPF